MTRDEAIEILESVSFFAPSDIDVDTAIDMAIESLERKDGVWIKQPISVMNEGYAWQCSECGHERFYGFNQPHYNYCPNCGADMRGEHHD